MTTNRTQKRAPWWALDAKGVLVIALFLALFSLGARETADPEYPGVAGVGYREVFESIGVTEPKRIGVAGWLCTNMAMYGGLREAFPDAEIVNADELTASMRARSSWVR